MTTFWFDLTNYSLAFFLLAAPLIYGVILIRVLKRELRDALLPLPLFLVVTLVFMNKLLFGTLTLAQKDFNNIQVPLMLFFKTALGTLHVPPIWNSAFCGGFDAFSNPLAGYFSTFNWVFLVGTSVYQSFNWLLAIQIFLCLLFGYIMLRAFSFSRGAAVVGAVVFAFNGFVTSRLSPGVGVEYLFAYKWLPLIFAFTKLYMDIPKTSYLLGLGIAFAFSLEGNPNLVVATGVLWCLFLLVNTRKTLGGKLLLLVTPVLGMCIYAIKIVPTLGLFTTGGFRFLETASGWRTSNYDLYMFPNIFLPIKSDFSNGVFTPGLLALLICIGGLVTSLSHYFKKRQQPFSGYWFILATGVLAFVLTIENPLFYLFYSLPVLNRITIVPAFTIFYLIPIVFLCAYGTERITELLKMRTVGLFLCLAIFAEILLGPAIFGQRSYSFNFAKMDYSKEPYAFPHYNALAKQPPGTFYIADNPRLFLYPYAISLANLETLNGYTYFYGCQRDAYFKNVGIDTLKTYTDYLIVMNPVQDPTLQLIDKVSLSTLLTHQSHAVFENKTAYLALYDTGWNDDLYIYKVLANNPARTLVTSDPVSVTISSGTKPLGELTTNINYSPWLYTPKNTGVTLDQDIYGFLQLKNTTSLPTNTKLYYVNPYIYTGFGISLITLLSILTGSCIRQRVISRQSGAGSQPTSS